MKNKRKIVFINKNLNLLILKKKTHNLYLYNNKFFFFFYNIDKKKIFINKQLSYFLLLELNFLKKTEIINKMVNELTNGYYKKITFNGKGFKIKKKNKINFFFFNNSHIKALLENKTKILKNSKNSFLIFYRNYMHNKSLNFIKNLFKLNIFTKKGVKTSRQISLIKKIKKK